MPRETARYHTVAHTLIRKPGLLDKRIYVLYILSGEECIPTAMMPPVEYILEHGRTRSLAWQRELVRAIGLLVDFLQANIEPFRGMDTRPRVLAAFADALVDGTVDSAGNDPSGLYWEPKTIARSTIALNASSPDFRLSPVNLNNLGYQLLRAKNAGGAVELFKLATYIEPKYGNAFDSEGQAYEALGQHALAIAAYEKAVAVDKNQSNASARIKALQSGGVK